ncbi:MAG: diversity-generating retroelement protein Avd [Hyphomicrobiaceae bacterium]
MSSLYRRMGPALEAHYRFVLWLTPALTHIPRAQKFLLGDRIQTNAFNVLDALIEATYNRERRPYLRAANLGLERLRFFCRLAYDLKFFDVKRYEYAARSLDEIGRLIGGWAKADRMRHSESNSDDAAARQPV